MKTQLSATWIVALMILTFANNNVMGFTVSSPVVEEGGVLPAEFTGDGNGSSIPVEWSDVPSLAKAIRTLIANKSLREDFGKINQSIAEQFSWERFARQYHRLCLKASEQT